MAIVTYKKSDRAILSPHFRASEFACKGRGCCDQTLIDAALVEFLQRIRDHFGKPVTINSGYRCATHNKAVGGVTASRHLQGQAADIAVAGVAPAEVAKFAQQIGVLGIGLYETDTDGYFVHIDTRPNKSFWYGQKQAYREDFGGYDFPRFVQALQQAIGATADGIPGPETLHAAPTLGVQWNNRHPCVLPVQTWLSVLGYEEVGPADGIAGPKFAAAVAHFQQDQGLANTGILEQWGSSWYALLRLKKGAGL